MGGIKFLRYELGKPDAPGLKTNKWGNIVADKNGKSSIDRIYAGGDIVLGAATVILAMGEGRKATAAVNEMLKNS